MLVDGVFAVDHRLVVWGNTWPAAGVSPLAYYCVRPLESHTQRAAGFIPAGQTAGINPAARPSVSLQRSDAVANTLRNPSLECALHSCCRFGRREDHLFLPRVLPRRPRRLSERTALSAAFPETDRQRAALPENNRLNCSDHTTLAK